MYSNYYIIKVSVITVIAGLFMSQVKHIGTITEAKQYSQPYGDIVQDENENAYDVKDEANRYETRNRQHLEHNRQQPVGQRSDYATPAINRRRGQEEISQYHNIDSNYYNRQNHNRNGWIDASSIVEEGQPDNITEEISNNMDATGNKCYTWIPLDAFEKYPQAEKKQENKLSGSVYIEICCQGYAPMRWRGKTLCRPVCENCQNGRCIAPDICECYDEYVANDNGDCVFTCPLGCLNGRCYLDGSCECEPGFKLDKSRKFCKPICSRGCGNNILHNCTEPEVCGCIKGYTLSDTDCQPVCQHDCGNGGICQHPDICKCNSGFNLKNGICQADCYQKCDNGICLNRNRCICNPGFTYHEGSTQCIPV